MDGDAGVGGDRSERHPYLPVARLRQRRGRGLQRAGAAAEGGRSVRRVWRQHPHRSQGPQGARPPVPVGRRRSRKSRPLRLHQAAHHAHVSFTCSASHALLFTLFVFRFFAGLQLNYTANHDLTMLSSFMKHFYLFSSILFHTIFFRDYLF